MDHFTDGILWSVVQADVDASDILSDKTEHYENQTSDKKDGGDNRAPAHFDGRIYKLTDHDIDPVAEAKEGGDCSAYSCDARRGFTENAVKPSNHTREACRRYSRIRRPCGCDA